MIKILIFTFLTSSFLFTNYNNYKHQINPNLGNISFEINLWNTSLVGNIKNSKINTDDNNELG